MAINLPAGRLPCHYCGVDEDGCLTRVVKGDGRCCCNVCFHPFPDDEETMVDDQAPVAELFDDYTTEARREAGWTNYESS